MGWLKRFFVNLYKDFMNIYLEEEDIREHYGEDFAKNFQFVNPETGRRKKSRLKIFRRIVIIIIFALYLFLMVRMMITGASWYNILENNNG